MIGLTLRDSKGKTQSRRMLSSLHTPSFLFTSSSQLVNTLNPSYSHLSFLKIMSLLYNQPIHLFLEFDGKAQLWNCLQVIAGRNACENLKAQNDVQMMFIDNSQNIKMVKELNVFVFDCVSVQCVDLTNGVYFDRILKIKKQSYVTILSGQFRPKILSVTLISFFKRQKNGIYINKNMEKQNSICSQILRIPQNFFKTMVTGPRNALIAFRKEKVGLDDFCHLQEVDPAETILDEYKNQRKAHPNRDKVLSFVFLMMKILRVHIVVVMFMAVFATLIQTIKPLALKEFIGFTEESSEKSYQNLFKCIGTFVGISYLETLVSAYRQARNNQMHNNMHNQVKTMLFNKFIKLSSASKKNLQTGVLLNQYHRDTGSLGGLLHRFINIFMNAFKIFSSWWFLNRQIGNASYIVPIFVVLSIYLKKKVSEYENKAEKKRDGINDIISKLTNQFVSGIRVLKYYGWEDIAIKKIADKRKERCSLNEETEEKSMKTDTFIQILFDWYTLAVVSYLYITGFALSLPVYLFLSSMINTLRHSIMELFYTYNDVQRSYYSLSRLSNLLESEEREVLSQNMGARVGQVVIKNAKFSWTTEKSENDEKERKILKEEEEIKNKVNDVEKDEKKKRKNSEESLKSEETKKSYILDISELNVEPGQLVGVVGRVGCGKSTLVSAILQEISKQSGELRVGGSISYCPQTPWLMNSSIRSNILFKNEYCEERYKQIVRICELLPDLKILEKGDETIVGQKGVKLSGGQKQRISIARCLYSGADLHILDDCLSALDAGTGQQVFINGIVNYLHLKGKTVVMTLNALDYLRYCDQVVLMEDSKIQAKGSLQEVQKSNQSFFKFLSSKEEKDQKEEKEDIDDKEESGQQNESDAQLNEDLMTSSSSMSDKKTKKKKKEVEKEENKTVVEDGKIKVAEKTKLNEGLKLFYNLLALEGFGQAIKIFALLIVQNLLNPITNWYLGSWFNNFFGFEAYTYISFFFAFCLIKVVLRMTRQIYHRIYINKTLLTLNAKFMGILFRSNMSWFDTKTTGQIIQRTLHYQGDLEWRMSHMTHWGTSLVISLATKLFFILGQAPLSIIMFVLCYFVIKYLNNDLSNFNHKIHEVSQEEGEKFGSFLQESITGTYVIRAFNKTEFYQQKHYHFHSSLVELHTHWNRVMGTHKSLLFSSVSIVFITVSSYLMGSSLINSSKEATSAMAGILTAIGFHEVTSASQTIVSSFDFQDQFGRTCSKLKKIFDWVENCPQQRSHETPIPKENWLSEGKIQAKDISYRYREDLPTVIKNISFDIGSNQKIGVFGRTGSGKSTLTLGLLRILEVSQNKEDKSLGKLMMDETDISSMGLKHLRHSVAMIPQDPLLFSGTIRSNIDPYEEKSDEEIARCLKKVMIWDDLQENEDEDEEIKRKLEAKVEGEGANYSVGQRQLLCLARALVRNPKILLLDEATASIDMKTDNLIQEMLASEFKDTTVITIAHRLNTIIEYDKILVLKDGEVEEFDSPKSLLQKQDGYFSNCVKKVGPKYFKKMSLLARSKTN